MSMSHDEMIAVIAAHKEGKRIEGRVKDPGAGWVTVNHTNYGFDFTQWDYRVKPEPREPRVIWVNDYADGLGGHLSLTPKDTEDCRASRREFVAIRKFIEVIEDEK